ncbi:MAG: efflux RND transporter periplasmic adaptor subunit [Telmatospirillum sp.]|nr:efflux RND transporter periplasmic adaptor subunit [Telmatospirillum sp.]
MAQRLIGAVAIAASLVWAQAALAQGGPPQAPPVTVAKPVVKEIVEQDDYTGRFEAADSVELRARVSGYLEAVRFRDGQIVREGDLLFVIDKRLYQATLARTTAAVNAAQTRLDFARLDFERFERLARSGTAPERQLEQTRQTFQQAQADIAALRADQETARLNLGFTEIRSPLNGRIGRKLVSEGNLVTADQTLLSTIVSIDPIYLNFDIDERSYIAYTRRVQAGEQQSGRAGAGFDVRAGLLDERNMPRVGRLEFLDNRIDPASGTMRARATFPNNDGLLTPGLFGRVQVPGSNPYKAVLIPEEAIGADQDRRFVWVVADDGSVAIRLIRPGPRIDGYRIVRTGLDGSERIVVVGLQRVRPGGRVTAQTIELPQSR